MKLSPPTQATRMKCCLLINLWKGPSYDSGIYVCTAQLLVWNVFILWYFFLTELVVVMSPVCSSVKLLVLNTSLLTEICLPVVLFAKYPFVALVCPLNTISPN